MSYSDIYIPARRLFILRFLAEPAAGGEANSHVILSAARSGGYHHSTAADIAADLDHLRAHGAVTETWLDAIRVATLTERGADCAAGRIAIDGVEHATGWS